MTVSVFMPMPPPAISPSPRGRLRTRARSSLFPRSCHASKAKDSEWPHRCPERNRQWGATPKAALMAAFRYKSAALLASPLSIEGIAPAPSSHLPLISREMVEHPVSIAPSIRSGRPALGETPLWPACAKDGEIGGAPAILDAASPRGGPHCKADAPEMKEPRVFAASMPTVYQRCGGPVKGSVAILQSMC